MEQLQKALGKREEARAWLTNLREIAKRGGAKDETTPALFREYRQRFEQANEEVSSIRENLRSELAVLETQFEAYEGQMKKLYSSATEAGTISPDEYTKELKKITKEKSEVRERIAYMQQLIEADRPDDLAKVAAPSSGGRKFDTALKPSARDKGHIALRIIQGVAGLLIVAGAFLPSFKNPGEGTLSLYPGVEPTASGEVLVFGKQVSLSSFLWLVPVALGLAISVAALIPSRSWRGGFTLLLTAILLLVIVTSLVIMLAYPRAGPLEEKLGGVIKGVFALNVWPVLVCFVVGTLMAYILCFLNLLSSKVGIVFWALSLVFFVSFGVGLGSYFKTALKPRPIVQLAWDNPVGYEQNLTVIVKNRGNLPLEVIRPHTVTNPFEILTKKKSKPEKYQYALVLERQSSGDTWEKVDTLIFPGGGYGESSGGFVEAGATRAFGKRVRLVDERRTYRVALIGADDAKITSNPVMVEAQSASVSCSHASASATPSRAPSEDETAARKAVDTLAKADPDLPLENVGEMADNARDLIYRISDSRLKNELLEKVDECLLPVVERSVRNDLTLAREEFSMGLFNEAEEHVYEARAKYRTYLRMNDASIESRQLYQQAMALLHDIDKGLHPSWYYHVETIKRIDDVNQAVISDRQGNTYHLRENEIFAHFMVKEIDRSKGVVLERDGEVEVVRR